MFIVSLFIYCMNYWINIFIVYNYIFKCSNILFTYLQ